MVVGMQSCAITLEISVTVSQKTGTAFGKMRTIRVEDTVSQSHSPWNDFLQL